MMHPSGLDDRFKNGNRYTPAGLTTAQSTPVAVCIVVAHPDGHGDIICEAHKPHVVFIIRRARLPCYIGSEMLYATGCSACHDPLQHCLQLVKRRWIDGGSGSCLGSVPMQDGVVLLDRF